MTKQHKILEGFISQQEGRGIGVTPELRDHYEDVKYDELPWYKKIFTDSPAHLRDRHNEHRRFIQGLSEFFEELNR